MRIAIGAGAHSVMDLSTGRDLDEIRVAVLEECTVMLGTVPIYQVASEETIVKWTTKELFAAIEKQAKQGVDFMTLHAGSRRSPSATCAGRTGSRNRLARRLDPRGVDPSNGRGESALRALRRAVRHPARVRRDVLVGRRVAPGALADANDRGQIAEMLVLGELTKRAREKGCQVMIEGPGHVPIDQIAAVVHLEARLRRRPFLCVGSAHRRRRARLRPHHRSDRRRDCVGRGGGLFVLCDPRRTFAFARQAGCPRGGHRDADRRALGGHRQENPARPRVGRRDVALSQGARLARHVPPRDGSRESAPIQGRERGGGESRSA